MSKSDDFRNATLLHDHPVADSESDRFLMADRAQTLAMRIGTIDVLPVTVGVFGPWGSGKTSFLKLLGSALEKENINTKVVWFNAWKYQTNNQVWVALLQEIVHQIERDSSDPGIVQKAAALGKMILRFALGKAVQLVSSGLVTGEDVDSLLKKLADSDNLARQYECCFDAEFDELVASYTNGGRLIVLLDDLDRCLPDTALQILEALKLFLDNSQCVFIVALDIDRFYKGCSLGEGRLKLVGQEYVEKLVQVPIYLASPAPSQLREFVEQRMGVSLSDHVWSVVREVSATNPRRAQRFANALVLVAAAMRFDDIVPINMARLLAFKFLYPDFFERLRLEPGLWSELDRQALEGALSPVSDVDGAVFDFIRRTGSASGDLVPAAPNAALTAKTLEAVTMFGARLPVLEASVR